MAIYSTFFVAAPDDLLAGFPEWKLPLPVPVRREMTDFFGQTRIVETREPEWDDVSPGDEWQPAYEVVSIAGDYAAYLEARLPDFVRAMPHWCAKGLTNVELDPLGELTDGQASLTDALYAHPSRSAHLQVFRAPVVQMLADSTPALAAKWAAQMSTPEYTHSADGSKRLQEDWSTEDALFILDALRDVVSKAPPGHRLYLLVEW